MTENGNIKDHVLAIIAAETEEGLLPSTGPVFPGGEINTASNVSEFGLYKEKVGVDLRFRGINTETPAALEVKYSVDEKTLLVNFIGQGVAGLQAEYTTGRTIETKSAVGPLELTADEVPIYIRGGNQPVYIAGGSSTGVFIAGNAGKVGIYGNSGGVEITGDGAGVSISGGGVSGLVLNGGAGITINTNSGYILNCQSPFTYNYQSLGTVNVQGPLTHNVYAPMIHNLIGSPFQFFLTGPQIGRAHV